MSDRPAVNDRPAVHTDPTALRAAVRAWKAAGDSVALVPTMGALHEGHLSLVRLARERCRRVLVSIFVNPSQFGPQEDLARYPRTFERDLDLLAPLGVEAVFAPADAAMYGAGYQTWVTLDDLPRPLCGASRPVHFRGVATVVSKLFNICEPDVAVFGQKDYQQAQVIRRLARDLDFPVEILVAPIVREADGLAMSSRNRYLSAEERPAALVLRRALDRAVELADGGATPAAVRGGALAVLSAEPLARVDYVEVLHPETLAPIDDFAAGAVVAVAAYLGATRLIDNQVLDPRGGA